MKKLFYACLLLTIMICTLTACEKEHREVLKESEQEHIHSYGEWETVKEATCTKEGLQERTCSCGEKESEIISASHNFSVISAEPPSLISKTEQVEKCSKCNKTKTTVIDVVDPKALGMPVIYINDTDPDAIPLYDLEKSDGEIMVKYKYVSNSSEIESFECFCEIKIQGASSQYYPKKNFTVKFFEDEALSSKLKVDLGWGKQNKYCMKANYIDSSQARNVVGAKLFSEIVQTRENINPGLAEAPNYGVIDGYPVVVYLNGEFHGLYTMNIPKDKWTFNMTGKEESREALLMADHWSNSVFLQEKIGDSFEASCWEVEHCSTADDSWIKDSFNSLIDLLNCGNDERIKQELHNHLDIEAAIDNMLFTYTISASDNIAKNILWATYDGEVWIPSMYDMDGTFGIFWNGQPWGTTYPEQPNPVYPSIESDGTMDIPGCKLYEILIKCYADEVQARWAELRQSVLSLQNISKKFDEFFADVPDFVYYSDFEKWNEIPYAQTNLSNMYTSVEQQLLRLDEFFEEFNK